MQYEIIVEGGFDESNTRPTLVEITIQTTSPFVPQMNQLISFELSTLYVTNVAWKLNAESDGPECVVRCVLDARSGTTEAGLLDELDRRNRNGSIASFSY